jgi:hypothetical protein
VIAAVGGCSAGCTTSGGACPADGSTSYDATAGAWLSSVSGSVAGMGIGIGCGGTPPA